MKETPETQAIEELISEAMPIVDQFIEEVVDELANVGSPEKVLDKKYEDWTPEDFQKAQFIFGEKLVDPVHGIIPRKEVDSLLRDEAEEG